MPGPKPLVFADAKPAPKKEQVSTNSAALKFKDTPPVAPKQATPVKTAAKSLDFSGVTAPVVRHQPQVQATSKAHIAVDPRCNDALAALKTKVGDDLYLKGEMEYIQQVTALVPLGIDKVIEWGDKALNQLRMIVADANLAMEMITRANANETIKKALEATQNPSKGVMSWLSGKSDPKSFIPQLETLSKSLPTMTKSVEPHVVECGKIMATLTLKTTVLSAVAESVGVIRDQQLESAINNRRLLLSQGAMQVDLLINQLEQLKQTMITQKATVDQLLNITIPMCG